MSLAALPTLLLVPPLNCLAAACAGAALRRRRRRLGRVLLWGGLAGLLLLSIPVVSGVLIWSLENGVIGRAQSGDPPEAIVILGGNGSGVITPDGAAYSVGWLTLERERAGSRLARTTGLQILVSGGPLRDGEPSLASLMANSLHEDFGLAPQWLEARSMDTWENASMSAAILRKAGIGRVYVVTHAWHMRRALIAFRAAGLDAVAAPVDPEVELHWYWQNLIPRVSSWEQSYFAIHEWIGCAWYSIRLQLR